MAQLLQEVPYKNLLWGFTSEGFKSTDRWQDIICDEQNFNLLVNFNTLVGEPLLKLPSAASPTGFLYAPLRVIPTFPIAGVLVDIDVQANKFIIAARDIVLNQNEIVYTTLDSTVVNASLETLGIVTNRSLCIAPTSTAAPVYIGIADQNVVEDGGAFVVSLFAGFQDPDTPLIDLTLVATEVGGPLLQSLVINPLTGDLTITQIPNANGVAVVSITATDPEGNFVTGTFQIFISPVNDAPIGIPAITGLAQEDETLTADTSGISDVDGLGAFSFQWLRGGVPIGGETNSTYTLVQDDVGETITVSVTYVDGDGTAEGPLLSLPTATVVNVNDPPVGIPVITGLVQQNETLTADTSGISDEDVLGAFSYQWFRDGVLVTGETASTYVLTQADVNAEMTVHVTYIDGEGTAEGPLLSAPTVPVVNVNDPPVVVTPVPDLTASVGTPPIVIDMTPFFDDPDLPADTLTGSLITNSNPALGTFSVVGLVGTFTPTPSTLGTTSLTVQVTDGAGLFVQDTFDITIEDNSPVFQGITPGAFAEDSGATIINLHTAFDDPDDPDTALNFTFTDGSAPALVDNFSFNPTSGDLTINWLTNANGLAVINLTATDPALNVTAGVYMATISSVPDGPPTVDSPLPDLDIVNNPSPPVVDLGTIFGDPNDPFPTGPLTYIVLSNTNPGVATAGIIGSDLTIAPAGALGLTTITIQATDADGLVTTDTFTYSASAPVISNVNVTNISENTFEVTWDTDQDTIGSVDFGRTTALADVAVTTVSGTSHSAVITGLEDTTPYHYVITATSVITGATDVTPDAIQSTAQDASIVAFLIADGNGVDETGNGHTAVPLNGAGFAVPGNFNGAFDYPTPTNDHVDIAPFDIAGSALTISAWVFADSFPISDGRIVSKTSGTASGAHEWMLGVTRAGNAVTGTGRIRMRLNAGGAVITAVAPIGATQIQLGVWTHVAMTYDGSFVRGFVNGAQVHQAAKGGVLGLDLTKEVGIGNNPNTIGNRGWDGQIADVRFYSRALSPAELTQMSNDV